MKHISDENAVKEIEVAIAFDIRDNPQARNFIEKLVRTKGAAGVHDFNDAVLAEIAAEYKGDRSSMMFPWTRAAVRTLITGGAVYEDMSNFGLGFWGALIGGVLSAGIQAGATIYTTKLTTSAQKDIATIQVDAANKQAAALEAQAKAAEALAVERMQASGGSPFGPAGVAQAGMGMNLTSMLPILAIGVAAIFILPKILKK
jgi:hypothetical protein